MKNRIFLKVLSPILAVRLLVSCMGIEESDPSSLSVPEMKTFEVKDNGSIVFELTASVGENAIGRIASCGFYYGKKNDMSDAERIECKLTGNTFAADLTLHEYGGTFYACSYISNGLGSSEICSESKKISVGDIEDYVGFEGPVVLSYGKTTAEVQVKYVVSEGVEVTEYGICYGETDNLDINDFTIKAQSEKVVIEGLKTGESYYMCAYLKDGLSVIYGKSVPLAVYGVPEIRTELSPDVESTSAVLCGKILTDCGKEVTECGFLWCEGAVESLSLDKDTKIKCDSKVAEYSASLEGLSPNRTYSFCAYAVNAEGVAYGQVVKFTTGMALPEHGSPSVSDITSSSAVVAGNILSEGGEAASERGFCWGLDKTVEDKVVCKESDFAYTLTGLKRNTTYYVKSYSTNSKGTAGSDIVEFMTLAELPVVETLDVTDITGKSAICGGKIVDDGGSEILAYGVVWSTEPNPTVDLTTKTKDTGEDNSFSSDIAVLLPGTTYYVRAYATNSAGTTYGNERSFKTDGEPLEIMPAANCFVVSKPGTYSFITVKGNSTESVGTVASAEVLWESFGTSTAPEVGDLVESVYCGGYYVTFQTSDTFYEGNAVIAVKDAGGKILWSWHIWLTDEPHGQVYNNVGTMMDRNLGATCATPGDVGALGLLYQWGRKDPFLGSSSISSSVEAKSTITWPSPVSSSSSRGTIAYAVEHPTTFITYNSSNHDWYYTGSSTNDNTRWQSKKTIYDPCPAGWRVPDGGSNGVWSKALGSSSDFYYTYSTFKRGINFLGKFSSASTVWYPASGMYGASDGVLGAVSSYGDYWSVTPNGDDRAFEFLLRENGYVDPCYGFSFRGYGFSVRCLQE